MELKGKIIAFLGDSITEGATLHDAANRYDNALARRCGLERVYNMGVGGTRLAHQRVPSDKPRHDLCFCGRAYDIPEDAQVIVVYGGINDYRHGDAPIGRMGDSTPATFCGAVAFLMALLKTQHPQATVVFLTPQKCVREGDDYLHPSTNPHKLGDAQPEKYYCDVIVQTAQRFQIPVLNLYERLPVDPMDPASREKYTSDGVHLNDAGHLLLSRLLEDFLRSL